MAGPPYASVQLVAVRLTLQSNRSGLEIEDLAPEAAQLGEVLVGVVLDRESNRLRGQATYPTCRQEDDRRVRITDRDAVAIPLVALREVKTYEIAKCDVSRERLEGR